MPTVNDSPTTTLAEKLLMLSDRDMCQVIKQSIASYDELHECAGLVWRMPASTAALFERIAKDPKCRPEHFFGFIGNKDVDAKFFVELAASTGKLNATGQRENMTMTLPCAVARENRSDILKILVETGIDVHAVMDDGANLLDHANATGAAECAEILEAAGAQPTRLEGLTIARFIPPSLEMALMSKNGWIRQQYLFGFFKHYATDPAGSTDRFANQVSRLGHQAQLVFLQALAMMVSQNLPPVVNDNSAEAHVEAIRSLYEHPALQQATKAFFLGTHGKSIAVDTQTPFGAAMQISICAGVLFYPGVNPTDELKSDSIALLSNLLADERGVDSHWIEEASVLLRDSSRIRFASDEQWERILPAANRSAFGSALITQSSYKTSKDPTH